MVTPAAPKAVVQLVIDLRENELISQELIAEVLLDLLEDRQHQAALLSISQILQAVALITNPVLENSETATNVDTLKGFTKVGVERISSILDSLPDWIKADKSEACGGEVTCLVVTASCLALDAMASQSPSEQTLICSKDAAAKLLKCCELHGLDKASEQKMDMWKALMWTLSRWAAQFQISLRSSLRILGVECLCRYQQLNVSETDVAAQMSETQDVLNKSIEIASNCNVADLDKDLETAVRKKEVFLSQAKLLLDAWPNSSSKQESLEDSEEEANPKDEEAGDCVLM